MESSSRAVDAVTLARLAAARGASAAEPLGGEPQVLWLFLVQAAASVGELPDRRRGRWIDPAYGEMLTAVATSTRRTTSAA
ncbi:hypothetical protein SGA01_30590 [Streptomyces gardneri]|uniref:Uncharacterized protein n=1 Tax=Streptomyces gardneri TaxID=66892 RepID=A0A4Y3RJ87_9ACTN|nr:hypothetical protein SGA01_30590 [Streptomyces gardneri]